MKVVNSRFAVQDAGHFEEDLDCGWLCGACETVVFFLCWVVASCTPCLDHFAVFITE